MLALWLTGLVLVYLSPSSAVMMSRTFFWYRPGTSVFEMVLQTYAAATILPCFFRIFKTPAVMTSI